VTWPAVAGELTAAVNAVALAEANVFLISAATV
jgi:hypothetical protein